MHISSHPVLRKPFKEQVTFYFNGEPLTAWKGQTVAAALIANGIKEFGKSRKLQQSRGLFCANGRCCSCFVTIDQLDHVLSCMTLVAEGMSVYPNLTDPDVRRGENGAN